MKKILLNFLFFLFSILCFSQSIDLVRFDDTKTYNPGSGVSMHINPTGIFVLDDPSNLSAATNNAFHLELSAPGGDFTNPISLGTVYDFYTPLMNGVIPTGTASGNYKLRVRSTQPVTNVETASFTIDNSVTSALPTVQTTMQSNTNYFECLNDGANTTNPYFGSLKQSYDAVTADMPSSYKFLQVTASDSSYSLNVNLIDIDAGTTTALTATSPGVYSIPDTLSVGAYNIEIEEVDLSGNSSFFSTTFIFHASATIFGNASSEIVCVGEDVVFSIDITNLGIGSNYMASYYTFDFGDGTAPIIKTQAELLEDYTAPVNPIIHIFSQASCSTLSTNFDIEMKLYNKGLSVGGSTPACDEYIANGSGTTKQVTTSRSPEASFVLNSEQCINENISAINTSIAGSYPTPSGECTEEPNYYWYYKPPTATAFIPVFAGSPWLVGNDLIIPAADITILGCWEIKLTAVNQDYCQQESEYTDTINVEEVPEADFNIIKDNQEVSQICVNDTVTLTDNSNIVEAACDETLPNEDPTYQWTISPDSGYTLQNSTTLNSQNPEVTFTTEGTYTITLVVTTDCGSDSHAETLEVIGNPTVAFPVESQTYCSTTTLLIDFANLLTPTYSTGLNAQSSYTWTVSGTGITGADYSFANSTTASDALPTIQLNSFGTYNITVTLGSNCDTPASDTVSISLGQTPIITTTTTSQAMCSADSSTEFTVTADATGTTFSWIATDNSNLSGYTSSGTTAAIPAQTITNNTNSDQDLVYTITPIADGCAGTPFEYTITVNPVPLIADKDETICSSGTFTITPVDDSPTEIVPSGTTYDWGIPVSSPVGAITGGSAADDQTSISQTLTNITSEPATLTYSVQADANGCKGDGFDIVITVNPNGQVNAVADQTLCNGDSTLAVTFATTNTGSGTTTYNWTNDNTTIGLAASGTGDISSFTATSSAVAPIVGNITVTPVYENNGVSCTGTTETFSITVNPSPLVNFSEADQVIATGETTTAVNLTSPTTGVTFAWTVFVPTGITGVTTLTGTDNIPAETLINSTTEPLNVVYTAIATGDVGFDCEGLPTRYKVTVNPQAQVNPVDNQVVCNDENLTIEFSTIVTGGTTTFSWTNDNTAIGLDATGTGNIDITAINTTDEPLTANIVVTPSFENNGDINTGDSITFTITVNPTAQVESIDSQVLCNGESTDAITFTTTNTDGTTSYSWTNDNTSTGLAASGTGDITPFTAINTSNSSIGSTITVTPTYTNNGISCTGPTETFTITVNPTAQVEANDSQVLCNGESTDAISFTTTNTDGTTSYSWTNDNTTIGLPTGGGTGDIASFVVTNTTSTAQTATLVITPTYTNNGVSCTGPTETFTITVNPTAQVNAMADQDLCEGDVTTPISFTTTNTDGITTYNWTNDNTLIGLLDNGIGDIPSFSATNNTDTAQIANIIVTPTYTNNGISCTGPDETFILRINPGAQVNAVDSQVLCNDDITTPIIFTTTNIDGTTTYTWTNDNTSIGLPSTGAGDIGAFTAVNTSTNTQVATIAVTPTYDNNGVICIGQPEQFTITVNPSAQVDGLTSLNTILCDGEFSPVYTFTTSNTDGITSYNWTNDNPLIGLADSGSGGIPSFAVENTTSSTISATITVTPSYDNNGVVCSGLSDTFTITVNLSAQMDPVDDIVLCNNEESSIITFTTSNTDGSTTYNWTNDNTSIGLGASGAGDIPGFTATNPSIVSEGALITVTPTYENNGVICIGSPETFSITVLSEIVVSGTPSDAVDCDNPNSGSVDLLVSGGSGSYSFLWSNGADTEDLSNVHSGDYTVEVTDSEGCTAQSGTFTIWRQDDLIVDLQTTIDPNCIGNFVSQINDITVSGGVPPYSINWSSGSVSIDDNTVMTAYENGTYTVLVTDSFGCQVETEIIVDFDELLFTNTSSGDYISVTWDFGDGSTLVSGDSVLYTYSHSGHYTVTQTVEYSYGCIEVSTEDIEVSDGYDIVLPTAFSPNGDGMNDTIRPVYSCLNSIEMFIYDTFGSLIYYENNVDLTGWNGILKGKEAENRNYLLVVKGVTIYQEEINRQGVFTLLR